MSETKDWSLTSGNEELGPDSFGGNDFPELSQEWLFDFFDVEGAERSLQALNAGLPVPTNVKREKGIKKNTSVSVDETQQASLYEKAIIEIDELRDELIELFHEHKNNQVLFDILEKIIHRIEKTILSLGGETEEFNPLVCMSGLGGLPIDRGVPQEEIILSNASTVVANTKKLYKAHNITSIKPQIIKDKPGIIFTIEGEENGSKFRIVGAAVAKENFYGYEAIDYVRHNGKGALSVKAFFNGKWSDVSEKFHLGVEERPITSESSK